MLVLTDAGLLKVGPSLKSWLQRNAGLKADATDDELKDAAVKAATSGRFDLQKVNGILKPAGKAFDDDDDDDDDPDALAKKIAAAIEEDRKKRRKEGDDDDDDDDDDDKPAATKKGRKSMAGARIYDRGGKSSRVEHVSDFGYSTTKSAMTNKHGRSVVNPFTGAEVKSQSEQDAAEIGAFFKHMAVKSGASISLTDHDRDLLKSVYSKPWAGQLNGEWETNIPGARIKSLMDDGVSGGINVVPVHFDTDVVTFPLLHGELFPLVTVQDIPRGRRIEGASISNLTAQWGGGDGFQIDTFDTTDMVAAIDTTIHTVDGAVEVGRDFLSDSPVEVGNVLTDLVAQRLMQELDRVIAVGNGTSEPEGLFNAVGVTTVNAENAGSGPPTLADYLTLLFALEKQYRVSQMRPVFVSNDISYQRSRSIRVDANSPSTDQRPVMTDTSVQGGFQSYETAGLPHKVQNDITNPRAAVVAMSRYRMYRRQGLEIRWEQAGRTLAIQNKMLLVFRARYGGRLMDTAAAAKWTNGQA